VLEGLCKYQQLLEKCLVSERNATVWHIGHVDIIADGSILRVSATQPVLLLLHIHTHVNTLSHIIRDVHGSGRPAGRVGPSDQDFCKFRPVGSVVEIYFVC